MNIAKNIHINVNEKIKAKEIRLISEKNEQLNIVSLKDAINIAKDKGLDLVEIAPNGNPPVCKIMNYGKYKFTKLKKEKEAKKKQKIIQMKEIKFRLGIEEHDLKIKIKNIQKFLNEGNKVKITIMFRGREINNPEKGNLLCKKLLNFLIEKVNIDKLPKNEGRNMIMILSPKAL